jgi:hypothetical protein
MFVKAASNFEWVSAGYEGAERAVLRLSPANGRTAVVRINAGSHGPKPLRSSTMRLNFCGST